ncbi:LOW QUALITY PROTEIN: sperm-associated antigen 11A-like [Panthera uncia]|uniref:LOW QUALITY PROTEIN: sperm-associated antigen 11A-like n=1 Tax=Panthera uncia TaxID=29064 RepID=UPI0020FF8FD6|nr:LOW QUALITY PROTEIN: sperm-associated antigen 11A-like [Panthera uncia]
MKVLFLFAVLFYLVQVNSGDIPPGIRDVICLTQHGTCRLFFCHFGEKKAEICSNPWNRCCVLLCTSTEAEISKKPETVGKKREP